MPMALLIPGNRDHPRVFGRAMFFPDSAPKRSKLSTDSYRALSYHSRCSQSAETPIALPGKHVVILQVSLYEELLCFYKPKEPQPQANHTKVRRNPLKAMHTYMRSSLNIYIYIPMYTSLYPLQPFERIMTMTNGRSRIPFREDPELNELKLQLLF